MNTTIESFQVDKEAAFTPKLGEVKPIDISSHGRRELDERIVTDLAKAVARDGGYLHPPAVRDEGEGRHRLIHGYHRVEAWKRCRGEQTPITVNIYPPHTPDALIEIIEAEENLLRKELTAAERTAVGRGVQEAERRPGGGASFGVGRGGGKWESDSHFNAGAPWPRQQGYGAAGRRQVRHRQARGEH